MASAAVWSFFEDVAVCAVRDSICAGSRASGGPSFDAPKPEAVPMRPTPRGTHTETKALGEGTRRPLVSESPCQRSEHQTRTMVPETVCNAETPELPIEFFHALAAMAASDARVAQRIQSRAWTEPRSLLEDRRAALRFRFLWQCIKMDHGQQAHRAHVRVLWDSLDDSDQQAFLQAYSVGPPTPDFFIGVLAPSKLMPTDQGSAWLEIKSKKEVARDATACRSPSRSKSISGGAVGTDDPMVAEMEMAKEAARAACLAEVASHLDTFAQRQPFASYEEWIAELHPESARAGTAWGSPVIDYRYYLEDSDHRVVWNTKVHAVHAVPARDPALRPQRPLDSQPERPCFADERLAYRRDMSRGGAATPMQSTPKT